MDKIMREHMEAVERHEANKRAMAAWPDLLATLRRIADATPDQFGHHDFAQMVTAFQTWAREAVSKVDRK